MGGVWGDAIKAMSGQGSPDVVRLVCLLSAAIHSGLTKVAF